MGEPRSDAIFDLIASKNECYKECARLRAEVERLTGELQIERDVHALSRGHVTNYADKIAILQRRVAALEAALTDVFALIELDDMDAEEVPAREDSQETTAPSPRTEDGGTAPT